MSFMDLSSRVRKLIAWQQVENERIHSVILIFKMCIWTHLLGMKARLLTQWTHLLGTKARSLTLSSFWTFTFQ